MHFPPRKRGRGRRQTTINQFFLRKERNIVLLLLGKEEEGEVALCSLIRRSHLNIRRRPRGQKTECPDGISTPPPRPPHYKTIIIIIVVINSMMSRRRRLFLLPFCCIRRSRPCHKIENNGEKETPDRRVTLQFSCKFEKLIISSLLLLCFFLSLKFLGWKCQRPESLPFSLLFSLFFFSTQHL